MNKHVLIVTCINILVIMLFLELLAPKLIKTPHLVYREWGNRPLTFYPNNLHRQVTPEADVYFRTNSLGFKDVEHVIEKTPGVYRILLLGDSFLEGASVPVQKQISRQMEEIALIQGMRIEVISMGMSGWGQAHHLSTYMRLGRKFHPDLVISFFCSNDLWNNEFIPDFSHVSGNLLFNLPERETPNPLSYRIFRASVGSLESYFVMKSLIQNIYKRGFISGDGISAAKLAAFGEFPVRRDGEAVEKKEQKVERLVGSQSRRQLFEALIVGMKREVVEKDGIKWINTIVSADVRKDQPDFNWYMNWIEGSFTRIGVKTINFHKLFREHFLKTGEIPHFFSDVHWNEKGHGWVAQKLVSEVDFDNEQRE